MRVVERITGPGRAEALAHELNANRRARPAVVVSIPNSSATPWIDVERLARELGDLADVFLLATVESSWAFAGAMPAQTQAYGGAGRVYPVSLDWVHDPARSRLRFAYSAAEGEVATARLIEDALAAALASGGLTARPGAAPVSVPGVVKGCPTPSQALVAVAGGYATIQLGMTVPGVPSDRVFAVGMAVRGVLDQRAGRLDVRASLPDPATRLGDINDGDVLWARVESVSRSACEIAPYPGAAIRVPWEEVTTSAADDLYDLMSVGETVAVRAQRASDGTLGLSLVSLDDLDAPCSALSIFPDGPAWLLAPEPPAPRQEAASGEDVAGQGSELVLSGTVAGPTASVPAARSAPPSTARPTPLLIGRQRRPHEGNVPGTAAPTTPAEQSRGVLRGMGRQLDAARARAAVLEAEVKTAQAHVRSAQVEMRLLARDLSQHARDLAAREEDLRRLRARIRKNVQEERRVAGRREAAPGEALFLDPADEFRFEVHDRWARRIPAAEKAAKALRSYCFGPRFLDSLAEIEGVDRSKVADVVVDILTGLAENSAGRDMHPLRTGMGGDDAVLRREGYTCWRVAIQRRTPQARRLHFWRSADDIELSRVVLHDDYNP